jgi:hypothetical protein
VLSELLADQNPCNCHASVADAFISLGQHISSKSVLVKTCFHYWFSDLLYMQQSAKSVTIIRFVGHSTILSISRRSWRLQKNNIKSTFLLNTPLPPKNWKITALAEASKRCLHSYFQKIGIKMHMSLEHWWPCTDREKQKYSEKNRSSQQNYKQSALHIKIQLLPLRKSACFH